jgi:hypothetical protein
MGAIRLLHGPHQLRWHMPAVIAKLFQLAAVTVQLLQWQAAVVWGCSDPTFTSAAAAVAARLTGAVTAAWQQSRSVGCCDEDIECMLTSGRQLIP